MKLGFVGLGKMGSQIVKKLLAAGNTIVVYDIDEAAVAHVAEHGAEVAHSREDLIAKLGDNPVIWLMIPSDYIGQEVAAFAEILPAGSTLIDGGNTNYQLTIEHAALLANKGSDFIDIGTSGGIMGLANGFCLMVGGSRERFDQISPILDTLASPHGAFAYMGQNGYGHYVKMVHNGIEYGVMQALAEGYHLLKDGPLQGIPLGDASEVWQHGSIVESTLNRLVAEILAENPSLEGVDGYVADSGEGRWTLEAAHTSDVKMPVLEDALNVRVASQNGDTTYATQLLAALRNKFGGHAINSQQK
jgi:6-phosphogluconate dehydrogenase